MTGQSFGEETTWAASSRSSSFGSTSTSSDSRTSRTSGASIAALNLPPVSTIGLPRPPGRPPIRRAGGELPGARCHSRGSHSDSGRSRCQSEDECSTCCNSLSSASSSPSPNVSRHSSVDSRRDCRSTNRALWGATRLQWQSLIAPGGCEDPTEEDEAQRVSQSELDERFREMFAAKEEEAVEQDTRPEEWQTQAAKVTEAFEGVGGRSALLEEVEQLGEELEERRIERLMGSPGKNISHMAGRLRTKIEAAKTMTALLEHTQQALH